VAATTSTQGAAGAGLASSISGSSVTYGTGAIGGGWNIGGISFGIANTGNAGAGGGGSVSSYAGGSGIVVLRYPSYLAPAEATTGSPQTYIAGPYRVYVFTSSGSITF
jgi:hypothetical protein